MSTSEVNVAGTPIVISGREEFCFKVKYRIGIFPLPHKHGLCESGVWDMRVCMKTLR